MKISRLPDRLDRMPMLKILVFFAAGIALADRYELPLWFLAGAFVVTGVLALSLRSSAATAAPGRALCAASLLGESKKEGGATLTLRIEGGGPGGRVPIASSLQ